MIFRKKIKPHHSALIIILIAVSFGMFFYIHSPKAQRSTKYVLYAVKNTFFKIPEKKITVKLNVPYHRQEHALSCEIAALKMALNFYGVKISESELLAELAYDTKLPRSKDNIWGDPDLGFVGNINGNIPNQGYGVYEQPIADIASKFRKSKALKNGSLSNILTEVAEKHPVIVWGTLASGKDISWKTKEGKFIKAIYGEHTRVVIGFSGTVSNPKYIIFRDPIYGTITMTKKEFLKDWALLGNKAVVVY